MIDQKTCMHPYYKILDGKLVCTECGAPSPRADRTRVETKDMPKEESKKGKGEKSEANASK